MYPGSSCGGSRDKEASCNGENGPLPLARFSPFTDAELKEWGP